jgi:ADP-ribosylglycohydrolase
MSKIPLSKYKSCLIGGAIGDALGAAIEFMDLPSIKSRYGEDGLQDYQEFPDETGEFTDDTQMTLFTAEALLRAYHRFVLRGLGGGLHTVAHRSYLRWLYTQGIGPDKASNVNVIDDIENGWLIQQKELFKRRAPGNTCINAFSAGVAGRINQAINDSKGCGTIMRVAPVGLFFHQDNQQAFKIACELSAITHGHPTGYLSAGFFASVIADLTQGLTLYTSIENAIEILKEWEHHEETLNAVNNCLDLFHKTKNNRKHVFETTEQLGAGWVAEEALVISLYCSLLFEHDFKNGVIYAINHSGDSDSTGSITGNILGLINGESFIPAKWIEKLKYSSIVLQIAEDLHTRIKGDSLQPNSDWWEKYPAY